MDGGGRLIGVQLLFSEFHNHLISFPAFTLVQCSHQVLEKMHPRPLSFKILGGSGLAFALPTKHLCIFKYAWFVRKYCISLLIVWPIGSRWCNVNVSWLRKRHSNLLEYHSSAWGKVHTELDNLPHSAGCHTWHTGVPKWTTKCSETTWLASPSGLRTARLEALSCGNVFCTT